MIRGLSRRARLIVAGVAAAVVVAPFAWVWAGSFVPPTYSVAGMGTVDFGGGPAVGGHVAHGDTKWVGPPPAPGDVSVADLTGPRSGRPDVALTLVVRAKGDGYTVNGRSPGPPIRAHEGDLVQVRLVNANVSAGVTLHWHGMDVPNAEDGVAGVTQDAVPPGGHHVYRFVADHAGTFWYHSHQVASEQVRNGLFGMLLVLPRAKSDHTDVLAPVHTYDGQRTVAGKTGVLRVRVRPGTSTRVRVVNTDNSTLKAWVTGAGYRVLAVDGRELHRPTTVRNKAVVLGAGARADLEVVTPDDGTPVRVELGGGAAVALAPDGATGRRSSEPGRDLDLLSYGSPRPLRLTTARPDRVFDYRIGRRPGFVDGKPGIYWSVNGHLFPDVPMFMVREGDVVRMRIGNDSGESHPMHLHGHHALVLSRNGVQATGSPWWVDSLDVENGESYEVAFTADNPGIWMDHCHNLPHVSEGLVAHLMYAGVSEPYRVGETEASDNDPE